jgi:hypothetical protein
MSKKTEKSDRKKALIDIIETDEANGLYEMTEKEKLRMVSKCFENTIWMAIRYANGRHTYAPYIVRDSVKTYRELYPEWNLQIDKVVVNDYERFNGQPNSTLAPKEDWLIDLFENHENKAVKGLVELEVSLTNTFDSDERIAMAVLEYVRKNRRALLAEITVGKDVGLNDE